MNAAGRDVADALRAVRRAWPAVAGLAVSVVLLAADLFIRSVPLALATELVFAVCLGWWGTAAIRLHGAIRRAESHQESKGEVR